MGVETIEVDGVHRDYLRIQYAGEDRLFVPIDQISLLHKYIGSEGQLPDFPEWAVLIGSG